MPEGSPALKKQKLMPEVQTFNEVTSDSLKLAPLFEDGHGQHWLQPLSETLHSVPNADQFIGPDRDKAIMPVRELTFQALKPHRPVDWNVLVFGQSPYPRLESATGIAMFDAAVDSWDSKAFGRAASLRCIIKAAAMAAHGISEKTAVADLRKHLAAKNIITPPQWFQAMLSQGILLLNAALTVGGMGETRRGGSVGAHAKFWRPVIHRVLETILEAKAQLPDGHAKKSLVFLHWGGEALKMKKSVAKLLEKYSDRVVIRHVQHCNPAAQGELFCKGPLHFKGVNTVLREVGLKEVNWLPDKKWMEEEGNASTEHGAFIAKTQELHQMYLERLQNGLESVSILNPIRGVLDSPLVSIGEACRPLKLERAAARAREATCWVSKPHALSEDEASSIFVYTGNALYSSLNKSLRDAARVSIQKYFAYLRLFLAAHDKLPDRPAIVYRGISKDLSSIYKEGADIAWYSVSSCSSNKNVAVAFAGGRGTLFCIETQTAKDIKMFSYYQSEDELVLAPGTKLKVVSVLKRSSGQSEIRLREIVGERYVL